MSLLPPYPKTAEGLIVHVNDSGQLRADVDSLTKTVEFTQTINAMAQMRAEANRRANDSLNGISRSCCCERCRTDNA